MSGQIQRTLSTLFNNDLSRVVLAVVLVVGTFALLLSDRPVPDFVVALDGLALGFYFRDSLLRSG